MLHSAFGVIGPTRAVSLLGRRFQRRAPTVGACRLHNNIARNYTYKYGSKYGALWTCREGTVYSAVFLSYIVVAYTMASNS